MSPLPVGARWSDAALALFEARGETAVSAAAGSGKTTALLELLRRKLAGFGPGEPLSAREVVAITFTERAGSELVERLGKELAAGARELAAAGDAERAARLETALRELPSMAVGTIHGFAAALLRQHPLEAGVDPDFAVLEEEEASDLLIEASIQECMAALDRGDPSVRRLVEALGSVRALADQAAALVRERATRGIGGAPVGVPGDPEAVESARTELLSAAADLAAMGGSGATGSGKAAIERLRARLDELQAEPPLPSAWEESCRLAPLAAELRGWRAGKRDPPALSAARSRLEDAAAALPPVAAEMEAAPLASALATLVGGVEPRYAAARARAGALDFDDILVRARDLLRDVPAVRESVRSRVRALLVDEYQDVNALQAQIFDLVVPPGGAEGGGRLRVAVGDAKQSIYRFRGADVSVFSALLGRLASGDGQVIHLRENHRSTAGVVDLVNAVLDADPGALGVPFGPEDRLRASRTDGESPAAELLQDAGGGLAEERRLREARAVAARVAELVASGRPPGDIALLFRRLTHVGAFERALREVGLPIRVARGGGFFQAPEVRDLGELCASIDDPGDGLAWAALLRSPLCALSDASLVQLARRGLDRLARLDPAEAGALLDGHGGEAAAAGERFRLRRLLETWRELRAARRRLDVGEILERAVRRLDLEAALLAGPDGERRAANLRKALGLARREASRGATPGDLARRLRRMALRPPREPEAEVEDGEAVSLVTVHQAKGLEWPVVFIPDLAARAPSSARRALLDERGRVATPLLSDAPGGSAETTTTARLRDGAAAAEAAESRRLLYVALTRARDALVLSGASGRVPSGSWADALSTAPVELLVRRPAPDAASAMPPFLQDGGPAEVAAPRLRPAPAPLPPRVAVTALSEYDRCPRRHWFALHLRLPEPGPESGHGKAGDAPDRATLRGTLAHALLAEVDLAAPPLERRALLAAAARRRGEDPGRPGVRAIVDDVERFLASPAGEELALASRGGRLRRELPFLLRLEGEPACYVDGAIDALDVGEGAIAIHDFKYARHHPGAEERYRTQIEAYALAVSRSRPGVPVRARLHFLREPARSVDVTPAADAVEQLAARLPVLAAAVARGDGRDASPGELGRDEARCRGEGCGFVARCFGAPRTGPGVI